MAKPSQSYKNRLTNSLKRQPARYRRTSWWYKIVCLLVVFIFLVTGVMYGIGQWYIHNEKGQLQLGASFVPDYAQSLGVDPQSTMDGLLNIGVRHFRLVSYWSDLEPAPGQYNFSQLDWQFQKAEAKHASIILALGLRQPRWPECHMPDWASQEPTNQWQPQLKQFIKAVVGRYKTSPSLQSYQLENEYFLQGFGTCTNFDRSRLVAEYNLVKQIDGGHKVIVSRSNNGLGIPLGTPKPDEYGISIYKRVWDGNLSHRYFEYPFPAWYYAFLAGLQKIHDSRDMIVHEMQAEAWAPNSQKITDISLAEQKKSLDAKRLGERFDFGKSTGMTEVDMWGAEYWYYRLQVLHDPSLWNVAQQEFGGSTKNKQSEL